MTKPPSLPRLRWLRLRFSLLWLLFFLMVALVFILTLLSWRRSQRPAPLTLAPRHVVMDSAQRFRHWEQRFVHISLCIDDPVG